jgi:hypothetical protein
LSTEQFRSLASEFMPAGAPDASLESFFENWVYGTGIPKLKLTYSTRGGKLTGTLSQSGVDDDFTAWFPISIQDGNRTHTQWVQTGGDPSSFSETVRQTGALAELPAGWLYTTAPEP